MSSAAMRANSSDSSPPEHSVDRESESDEVLSEEEDDASKETQNASSFPAGISKLLCLVYISLSEIEYSVDHSYPRAYTYSTQYSGMRPNLNLKLKKKYILFLIELQVFKLPSIHCGDPVCH